MIDCSPAEDPSRHRWYWSLRPVRGRWGAALDRWCVRTLGFSVVLVQVSLSRHVALAPALLLETRGRRSGVRREVVLPYTRSGSDLLVVGSAGGGPRDPSWVHNLRASPEVVITVGRERVAATARLAAGAERDRLLAEVSARRPHVRVYAALAARHGRAIECVVLSPRTLG